MHDPYAFPPMMGELDLQPAREGQHWKSYEKLGRNCGRSTAYKASTSPCVAPNAEAVAVVGDFNVWDRAVTRCGNTFRPVSGNFFVPGIGAGTHYKFAVKASRWACC